MGGWMGGWMRWYTLKMEVSDDPPDPQSSPETGSLTEYPNLKYT